MKRIGSLVLVASCLFPAKDMSLQTQQDAQLQASAALTRATLLHNGVALPASPLIAFERAPAWGRGTWFCSQFHHDGTNGLALDTSFCVRTADQCEAALHTMRNMVGWTVSACEPHERSFCQFVWYSPEEGRPRCYATPDDCQPLFTGGANVRQTECGAV